ncbi:MAG: diacylglycerol kinase family lipid kinase [Pseudonocardiaceae bacterium]|nr:diacylglycerol kinase family lipid kinase [Pseudonocardiaceae bacterium]
MRSFTAVVNPVAGGGRAMAVLLPVARLLREAGATVDVRHSRSLEHARMLARDAADDGDVVLAVGGDGAVGALAGPVVDARGVLGIVPAGRGNDFARQMGISRDPARIAELLLHAPDTSVDVISVAGSVVVCSVHAGVDSVATALVNRARVVPGALAYPAAALGALLAWRPACYTLDLDGSLYRFRGYTVVAANSGYYGHGLHVAPSARVDDGLLDVVAVHHVPRRTFLAGFRQLPSGGHVHRPEVQVLRGRELRLQADRPLHLYGDGEPITPLPATARIRPSALRLLAPPPAAAGHPG